MLFNSSERGVTIVEATIALPVFLMLVFGVIDTARYLMASNMLNSAANQAAVLASVIPGFDESDDLQRKDAYNEIRTRGMDILTETLFTDADSSHGLTQLDEIDQSQISLVPEDLRQQKNPISIIMPQNVTEDALTLNPNALKTSLKENPFEIRIHATVRTTLIGLIPGLPDQLNIEGRAVAFRETSERPTSPSSLDCNGNPVIPGSNPICPCPASGMGNLSYVDPSSGACVCTAHSSVDDFGTCGCQPPFQETPENSCECPNACPQGQVFTEGTCDCESDGCQEGFYFNETAGECLCQTSTCPDDDYVANITNNGCVCTLCEGLQVPNDTGTACICPYTSADSRSQCDNNQYFNALACECTDCSSTMEINSEGNGCVCKEEFKKENVTCNEGSYYDEERCKCVDCYRNRVWSEEDQRCKCIAERSIIAATEFGPYTDHHVIEMAGCTAQHCFHHLGRYATRDPNDPTQCICDVEKALNAVDCGVRGLNTTTCNCNECPGDLLPDPNDISQCICRGDSVPDPNDSTSCICGIISTDCPDGTILNSNTCECKPCYRYILTPNADQTECICVNSDAAALRCNRSGSNLYLKESNTTCQCSRCDPPFIPTPDRRGCMCDRPPSCREGAELNPETCECEVSGCGAGTTPLGEGDGTVCCPTSGYDFSFIHNGRCAESACQGREGECTEVCEDGSGFCYYRKLE